MESEGNRGEQMTKKLKSDCHLPNLLAEVLNNQSCWVLATPINITRGILAELAKLALEIDEAEIMVDNSGL